MTEITRPPEFEHELGTIVSTTDSYGADLRFFFRGDSATHVDVNVPDTLEASAKELADGCTVNLRTGYYGEDVETMRRYAALLDRALTWAEARNAAMQDLIEAARVREAKEQAEREAAKAKRQEVLAERKERLLHEFVGEDARIRLAGMKRWRPVRVDALETGVDGEFVPALYYKQEKHGYRVYEGIDQIRAFEIKVGSRYQTVWNDGKDDLPTWDRSTPAGASQPYDGSLA